MIASSRFREYFDPNLPPAAGQQLGNVETVEMLNSAVPPTPVVIDVVPLLSWEEEGGLATGRTSTRHGLGNFFCSRDWDRANHLLRSRIGHGNFTGRTRQRCGGDRVHSRSIFYAYQK